LDDPNCIESKAYHLPIVVLPLGGKKGTASAVALLTPAVRPADIESLMGNHSVDLVDSI
jgi:hypothetical protein